MNSSIKCQHSNCGPVCNTWCKSCTHFRIFSVSGVVSGRMLKSLVSLHPAYHSWRFCSTVSCMAICHDLILFSRRKFVVLNVGPRSVCLCLLAYVCENACYTHPLPCKQRLQQRQKFESVFVHTRTPVCLCLWSVL